MMFVMSGELVKLTTVKEQLHVYASFCIRINLWVSFCLSHPEVSLTLAVLVKVVEHGNQVYKNNRSKTVNKQLQRHQYCDFLYKKEDAF